MNEEPTHKKGEGVAIYEDPITRKKLEGYARLEKFLGYKNDLEYWDVRFFNSAYIEAETHQRFISERETK